MIDLNSHNPPQLKVKLLGPFGIYAGGRDVTAQCLRHADWLVAALSIQPGESPARDMIAEWLWPTEKYADPRVELRAALSTLRKALGTESHRLDAPSRKILQMNMEGAEIDVQLFDRAIRRARELLSVPDGLPLQSSRCMTEPHQAEALAMLRRADHLHTGPFMQGCNANWVIEPRRRRLDEYVEALAFLAAHARGDGAKEQATEYWRRAVAADPFRASSVCALMEVLDHSGAYKAALDAYNELRNLHADFGSRWQPGEALENMVHQIHSHVNRERERARHRQCERGPLHTSNIPNRFTRWPSPLTRLIGRDQELRDVMDRLHTNRLVTLTGAGGIGKTRLAIEAIEKIEEEFVGGCAFVRLDSLTDPALILQQIAASLDFRSESHAAAGASYLDAVVSRLKCGGFLLVLDNCEHLLPSVAQVVASLLSECWSLKILTTSRKRLGLTGESVYVLQPLVLPLLIDSGHPQEIAKSSSVQLFLERAAAVRTGFVPSTRELELIANVCRLLDGIPLAIELAAIRAGTDTISNIHKHLCGRFSDINEWIRSEDPFVPPRQQTLHALIAWSYGLLEPFARELLSKLAVFSGGWSVESAEAVCISPGKSNIKPTDLEMSLQLSQLAGSSLLLVQHHNDSTRYRMLDTVRRFALEYAHSLGLESALQAVQRQHYLYFLHLAELGEADTSGEVLARLEAEQDNLRTALEWSLSNRADAQRNQKSVFREAAFSVTRMAGALWRFWYVKGYLGEGQLWLDRALRIPEGEQRKDILEYRLRALRGAGNIAYAMGDFDDASARFKESLELSSRLDDARGIARAMASLGNTANSLGDYDVAKEHLNASLDCFRQLGDRMDEARTLGNLALVARNQQDFSTSCMLHIESLDIFKSCENQDLLSIALGLNNYADVLVAAKDVSRARTILLESLTIDLSLDHDRGLAHCMNNIIQLLLCQKRAERATVIIGFCDAKWSQSQIPLQQAAVQEYLENFNTVRRQLSQQVFDKAMMRGRELATWPAKELFIEVKALLGK